MRTLLRLTVLYGALAIIACGGKAVIDDEPAEAECFDDHSCCDAAHRLMDEACPLPDGRPRMCPIDGVPDTCQPFLGAIYRCYFDNAALIRCNDGAVVLPCDVCTDQLEAAGEPCGQSNTCS